LANQPQLAGRPTGTAPPTPGRVRHVPEDRTVPRLRARFCRLTGPPDDRVHLDVSLTRPERADSLGRP
jgi:hypothetical protein